MLSHTSPIAKTALVQAEEVTPQNPEQNPVNPGQNPENPGQNPVNPEEDPVTPDPEKQKPTLTARTSYTIKYKPNYKFSLGVQSTGDSPLSFISTNSSVASVSSQGIVTLRGTGTCTITATSPETDSYLPTECKISISVWKSPVNLGYSTSYKRSKYYKKLKNLKLFGTTRNNLLTVAKSQVGYHESSSSRSLQGTSKGGGNYTEFGRFYGYNGVPWCAIFVNWVARENGISYNVVPKECAVRLYYSFFQKKHRAYSWNTVRTKKRIPKEGDIIFYSYSYRATTHHIGYVQSCTYKGSKIILKVVEGNHKNKVSYLSMTMKTSNKTGRIPVRGMYITGFASPKY